MPSWLTIKFCAIVIGALLMLNAFNYWRFDAERDDHELCKTDLTTSTNNVATLEVGIAACNIQVDAIQNKCIAENKTASASASKALSRPLPKGHGADVMNQYMGELFK